MKKQKSQLEILQEIVDQIDKLLEKLNAIKHKRPRLQQ